MQGHITRRGLLAAAALMVLAPGQSLAAGGLRDVTPQDAFGALQTDPSILVLDIRTLREFAAGHLEGAIHINYYDRDFAHRIRALDSTRTYVMYCQAGGRSHALMRAFSQSPFRNVMHIPAGFSGWRRQGLPFVK
ncbi:MAG: rhodanese-like domain-containing protein [Hoeflea sp.]|uniref:rhodanese-like domain-containing protein n=1 Tax=Hoeflea sp. TaxID=1940281 RepID=UPI001D6B2AA8|nr:rhodanese-like domain-containing protein [Hoeflea sp.]MBU4530252.1 rhodanese-like domain-containing protein [Alphaproteobacteria bacterium]MBU4542476.1 rhodanese-like domain-containing protein [Alphaproteobacteria bacterium]MBU4551162.1 rhodanese-like domain-containing protein [Alphaproteobacteria bacterium]MBV1723298.1 rhodanese-like domain-containing protein [Hoeflea sp.]MBV1760268.1 rhodanese-like domain-containing protein [Hoeflea sp.]